jgi:hypothetical protein
LWRFVVRTGVPRGHKTENNIGDFMPLYRLQVKYIEGLVKIYCTAKHTTHQQQNINMDNHLSFISFFFYRILSFVWELCVARIFLFLLICSEIQEYGDDAFLTKFYIVWWYDFWTFLIWRRTQSRFRMSNSKIRSFFFLFLDPSIVTKSAIRWVLGWSLLNQTQGFYLS